jgi:hypothetical protein
MKNEKIVKTIIISLGVISFLIIYYSIYFIRENINSTVTSLLLLSTAGFATFGIIYLLETKRV